MKTEQLNQLLYEALETEMGGVQVYKTAIRCAVNEELKEEWEEYLQQTQKHVEIVRDSVKSLGSILRQKLLDGKSSGTSGSR